MNLPINKIVAFLLLYLASANLFAYKFRPFAELSSAFYAPYPAIKNDFNVGLHIKNKGENYISIGIGIQSYFSFNIKETIAFKKKFLNYFEPLITVQFKYNNQRQYNALLETPANPMLSCKHSIIAMGGLQLPIKKLKMRIQFQSGISYNFPKIYNQTEDLFHKKTIDFFFNSITNFSVIKIF